jgi:hypothetical protein
MGGSFRTKLGVAGSRATRETGYAQRMASHDVSHHRQTTISGPSVADSRIALLKRAARAATDYLEGIGGRRVAPAAEAVARLSALQGPLPGGPTSPEAVLRLLDEFASPATVANSGGRYFGFVNGGSLPAAMAAAWLTAAPGIRTRRIMCSLRPRWRWKKPPSDGCASCSGYPKARQARWSPAPPWPTSARSPRRATRCSNACRMGCGRRRSVRRAGDHGGGGRRSAHIVAQGFGDAGTGAQKRIVRVPVDGQGRMRADALPHLDDRDHPLPASGEREYRRFRSSRGHLPGGAGGGRVDPCRRSLRPVGRRLARIPQA